MASGQSLIKGCCELSLGTCVRIDRRFNSIRHQRLKAAKALPIIEDAWIGQKFCQVSLVVAFEKNSSMRAAASNQSVKHLSRLGSAIDVIAEEDFNAVSGWIFCQLGVDALEHLVKQIRAAVNIADRIDADAFGRSRSRARS